MWSVSEAESLAFLGQGACVCKARQSSESGCSSNISGDEPCCSCPACGALAQSIAATAAPAGPAGRTGPTPTPCHPARCSSAWLIPVNPESGASGAHRVGCSLLSLPEPSRLSSLPSYIFPVQGKLDQGRGVSGLRADFPGEVPPVCLDWGCLQEGLTVSVGGSWLCWCLGQHGADWFSKTLINSIKGKLKFWFFLKANVANIKMNLRNYS